MNFNIWRCLVAGIIATAAMTGFINAFANYIARKFRIGPLLGTMLTGETTLIKGISFSHRSIYVGQFAHYFIGCILSALFYLWSIWWGGFSVLNTLLFGLAAGTTAIILWRVFFYVHSRPPRINLGEYCKLIFIGHVILSIVLFIVYTL